MDGITVDIFGNKAILDNLDAISEKMQAGAQAKLEEAAGMAKEYADEHAPVGTREYERDGEEHPGFLKSQNYVDIQPGIATIGNDAPYALFVEIGTSKMRAQPFLVPGWIDAGAWLKSELAGLAEEV